MEQTESRGLKRDCTAVQIPAGTTVTLPVGTEAHILQTLGGNFTVHALGGLYRITAQDADALGLEVPVETASAPIVASGPVSEEQIWTVLKTCYDPEIPVNIVDLGLIYDLVVEPIPAGGSRVQVKMTLTAPGCGMGPAIAGDAQQKILALDGIEEASVEVVWDPPWHQSMITAEGRKVLGLG